MVKLYCRTRLCELQSVCHLLYSAAPMYSTQMIRSSSYCPQGLNPKSIRGTKAVRNEYTNLLLFTGSSKLHFSPFCRCFSLHYTSYFFIHYVLCSVNPVFLSSFLYFCLSPLIFPSSPFKTLSHAWSEIHLRSLLFIAFTSYFCLSTLRLHLCRSSYLQFLYFHIILFLHICTLFPAFIVCLNVT
jgi:hypothetical protein